MCGIALIISGVCFDLSSVLPDYQFQLPAQAEKVHHPHCSVKDLKVALQRRGPDHLGSKRVFLQLKISCCAEKQNASLLDVEGVTGSLESCFLFPKLESSWISFTNDVQEDSLTSISSVAELFFVGATLQLRGTTPVYQPLVDTSGNVLVYNGEIFGGLHVDSDSNDGETLLHALGRCCSLNDCIREGKSSVEQLLSTIKGPWALIFWQDSSKTLWFGRDAFGRRSLLVHWPSLDDSRFLLSSVSPSTDPKVKNCMNDTKFWEELLCGLYSIQLDGSNLEESLIGKVRKHEWVDPGLEELTKWERAYVQPGSDNFYSTTPLVERKLHITDSTYAPETSSGLDFSLAGENTCVPSAHSRTIRPSVTPLSEKVCSALRESVRRRTVLNTVLRTTMDDGKREVFVPVAVLFSGGLDSMILAALLHECLDHRYEIDLLNVSFDGESAPDRISARAGVKELQRISPSRRWNLVQIDDELSNLTTETKHVMSLLNPSNTYMDLNIGIALWLAAGGVGCIDKRVSNNQVESYERLKYKSKAKILLVGSGADEQCAGYSRHRTKYRLGGWLRLHEEMKLDMQRIWKRNLGRDDRCISDQGKEARFPFLDEDVIRTLLEIPLWEVADLDQPIGVGDKKILREVAKLLGLEAASFLPKRAIQFGSRIARESNKKNFGSNRAANQASAGSVIIQSGNKPS